MRHMRKRSRRKNKVSEAIGVALMVVDLWRRLPSKRRRQVLSLARKHGPRAARNAIKSRTPRRGG
jgi:hypothetical protein